MDEQEKPSADIAPDPGQAEEPANPPSATAATQSGSHPLKFVPLLYFLQALPVALVQDMSILVFGSLGIDNAQVVFVSSLIALPWSFKLLWGPIVELNSTKRRWILGTQLGIGVLIFLFALALSVPNSFGIGMGLLALIAVFSATCDIATDGFYLLSANRENQKKFVGWQSAFYRIGRLFVNSAVVALAGLLATGRFTGAFPQNIAWLVACVTLAAVYLIGFFVGGFALPQPDADVPADVPAEEKRRNWGRLVAVLGLGVSLYFLVGSVFRLFGDVLSGAPPFAGFKLEPHPYVLFFYTWANSVPGQQAELINIVVALVGIALFGGWARATLRGTEMGRSLATFFGQPMIAHLLGFMLFYRFGEAMLGRLVPAFLIDKESGLALSLDQVAVVNGLFGVVGIVLGGIAGGIFVARAGLRRAFWVLAAAMNVPNVLYIIAAIAKFGVPMMAGVMFLDQFGYGVGFAGYVIALQAIAQRNPQYRTSHYAIGTGLGALIISLAGILTSVFLSQMDFPAIFTVVLFFSIPSLATIFLLPKEILDDRSQVVEEFD